MHHFDSRSPVITYSPSSAAPRYAEVGGNNPLLLAWVILIACAVWGVCGLSQTELAYSMFPRPGGIEQIRREMNDDREMQLNLNKEYKQRCLQNQEDCPPPEKIFEEGIVIHGLFEGHKPMLEAAKNSLLSDERLQRALEKNFGVNLQQLNVVVIPAWHMDKEENEFQLGISAKVREASLHAINDPKFDGFTVRDKVKSRGHRLTRDGRPRIALNSQAFNSHERLRRALLHESLHALNVPDHYPPYPCARHDLTYLKEYREVVELIDDFERIQDMRVWVFSVIIPFSISFVAFICIRRSRR